MKGSVTPVSGISRVTPPMMTNACSDIDATRPVAVNAAMSVLARAAVASPRMAKTRKHRTIAAPPSNPSSSPIAEKMKSVATKGMRSGMPAPSPTPVSPPAANANMDWTSW